MTYKHFVTVTSQAYFCASPIRLDSYNRCQFACVYCFSRERSIKNAEKGVKEANPTAFRARLDRVAKGKLASALDEFLARRVPVQLGGMQDPFSPWERDRKTTESLLVSLKEHDYPTIISTKGSLVADPTYLALLRDMNVVVRFSAAGIAESARAAVDYKCSPLADTLDRARRLNEAGIPASLRIQPVLPGAEDDALQMAEEAARFEIKHVSFEFLKLPLEKIGLVTQKLGRATGRNILNEMKSVGMKRLGPDYTLDVPWKLNFLRRAAALGKTCGFTVGAGDTELIHLSDGGGCCNGSALFLRDANQFDANLTGIIPRNQSKGVIQFAELLSKWAPERPVSTYLMTDSRSRDESGRYSNWVSLMAHRWNGSKGPYSPELFAGVTWTGRWDSDGFKIYQYENPLDA